MCLQKETLPWGVLREPGSLLSIPTPGTGHAALVDDTFFCSVLTQPRPVGPQPHP